MTEQLVLLVEGRVDSIISRNLIRAAGLPVERIEFKACGGKSRIARMLAEDRPGGRVVAALIDADELSVPDSVAAAKAQLRTHNSNVFSAVPCIEAWLFADAKLVEKNARSDNARELAKRLPLPELIPHPKLLASQIFRLGDPQHVYGFVMHADVFACASRSPSLMAFLEGISRLLGSPLNLYEKALTQSVSRDAISAIIRELPADVTAWRTVDGKSITADNLAREILEGSDLGKQYATELLRVARDLIVRKATRG